MINNFCMFWGIDLSSSHTQDKFYSVRHGQPACGRCYGRVELLCEGPSCLSGALDTISSLSLKDNNHDNYCVAVMKGYTVVGHVPRPASNVCFHFLGRGGHRGFCKVTGSHLNQGVNVGLEIPCILVYSFYGSQRFVLLLSLLYHVGR